LVAVVALVNRAVRAAVRVVMLVLVAQVLLVKVVQVALQLLSATGAGAVQVRLVVTEQSQTVV
jgi:hypothetical protein